MEVELLSASVLDRVPGWIGRPRMTEPLTGGITNRNYRVAVDGEIFVVRIPAASGSLLGIDRRVEREASRLAAAAGVGPDVIAFIEPEGVLVTRFIEGRPVRDHTIHDPVMLERIAQSLRRIHQAGSIASTFRPRTGGNSNKFRKFFANTITACASALNCFLKYSKSSPMFQLIHGLVFG